VPTGTGIDQVFEDVRRCIAEGRLAHACSLLQAMILDIGASPALREQKLAGYNALLKILFAERRTGRLSKVFRQAVSEFSEIRDPEFDNLYLAGAMATGTPLVPLRRRDRFLSLLRKFDETSTLEGRVAECGCFQGLSSFLLCSRARRNDPAFNGTGYEIYDSFQGLSEPLPQDMEAAESESAPARSNIAKGKYAATLNQVRTALAPFPGIAYFPGWIPDAFRADNPGGYRFVHVDVDLYQPTLDSFRYFWPRLVPGAVVVCDDYNWPGGKRAVHEFCAEVGAPFHTTPMQQAYFSRPA
jgi:O-methyltransferase